MTESSRRSIDRRRFLMLAGGGIVAAGCGGPTPPSTKPPATAAPTAGLPGDTPADGGAADPLRDAADSVAAGAGSRLPAEVAPVDDRVLVMIEFDGGNDGLDMVVPYADAAYAGLRPTVGLDPAEVLAIDDEIGLNPVMSRLHARGIATVEGVGTTDPDLSHFESMRRWHQGDIAGSTPQATGFLGRLCDQLDVGATMTGLSVGFGVSPALNAEKAGTIALPDPDGAWWLRADDDDPWATTIRQAMATMASGDGRGRLAASRHGLSRAIEFADQIAELPDPSERYEYGELSDRLRLSARLIDADLGLRVLHVPMGGFDTHSNHRGYHDQLLEEIDMGIDAFLLDLADRGLDDRVLVATSSEFGRRPAENDGGTDHGTASVALMAGPIDAVRHGAYPSLTDLDDGNMIASLGFDEYYAALAETWLGVPASEVLPNAPVPLF